MQGLCPKGVWVLLGEEVLMHRNPMVSLEKVEAGSSPAVFSEEKV